MSTDMKDKVGPGKFTAYAYKLYDAESGKLLFEAPADQPDVMVYGVSYEVIPGLVAAMKDLSAGDHFSVTLSPAAAFGERIEDNVVDLERQIFMRDGELAAEVKVGAELPMMTQEGFRVLGRVLDITSDRVKMDFNHPFAGLTVKYDGEIIEVRDATPEELQPAHGCGCGCGHDHGGCGDGCGCGGHDQEGSCCNGGCCS